MPGFNKCHPGPGSGPGFQHPGSSGTPILDCGSWPAMTRASTPLIGPNGGEVTSTRTQDVADPAAYGRQSSGVAVPEVAQYAWLNPFGHEEFRELQ